MKYTVRTELGVNSEMEKIEDQPFGHAVRMQDTTKVKCIWKGKIEGGRERLTWVEASERVNNNKM